MRILFVSDALMPPSNPKTSIVVVKPVDEINPSTTLREAERSARHRQVAGYFEQDTMPLKCRACRRKADGGYVNEHCWQQSPRAWPCMPLRLYRVSHKDFSLFLPEIQSTHTMTSARRASTTEKGTMRKRLCVKRKSVGKKKA